MPPRRKGGYRGGWGGGCRGAKSVSKTVVKVAEESIRRLQRSGKGRNSGKKRRGEDLPLQEGRDRCLEGRTRPSEKDHPSDEGGLK